MRILLLLAVAVVVLGGIAIIGAEKEPPVLCPTNAPFKAHEICECPAGHRLRSECTQPGLEYWQCVILEKELLYCVQ